MSDMILDEDGYERMSAHSRAASRAAVSRAEENEKLKAELERWKPKPMSSAPKDGSPFWAVYELGASLGFIQPWTVAARVRMDALDGIKKPDGTPLNLDFIGWFKGWTPEELKQIGGGK